MPIKYHWKTGIPAEKVSL